MTVAARVPARVDRLACFTTPAETGVACTRRLTGKHDGVTLAQSVDTAIASTRQSASIDW